jgi:hypothetical protein
MKDVMDESGAAIVYANFNEIDSEGRTVRRNVAGNESHHAGCSLMNLKLINEVRFREGLKHWDGLELLARIGSNFPVAYVERPMWLYRIREDSMSRTNEKERDNLRIRMGFRYGGINLYNEAIRTNRISSGWIC